MTLRKTLSPVKVWDFGFRRHEPIQEGSKGRTCLADGCQGAQSGHEDTRLPWHGSSLSTYEATRKVLKHPQAPPSSGAWAEKPQLRGQERGGSKALNPTP